MEQRTLRDPIGSLKGVGDRRGALYAKLGVHTIGGLLRDYPRDYLDLSHPVPIADTVLEEYNVIRATVVKKQGERRIRKGLSLFKVVVTDGESQLVITIFNSKFAFEALHENEEYYFYGKVTGTLLRREMNSPQTLPADAPGGHIRPIYSLTEGLSNKLIQSNMAEALRVWGDVLEDSLPYALRQKYTLCQLRYAMENIHFPESMEALAVARKRLVFEELLVFQLGMQLLRHRSRGQTGIRLQDTDLAPFLNSLPFTLTDGQKSAIDDAVRDMQKDAPMNRLVQGDVGSGKTMVAAALAYLCAKNGFQTAVMAPTQILAEQHCRTFEKQLAPLGVRVGLITASLTARSRSALLEQIRAGELDVIIGTHALVQQDVEFATLGLVVTDEQHRFGVEQRAALSAKGANPHLLVMSATPIPRTLALILYGDLDISVIREMPGGRKPIQTFAIDSGKRARALGFIQKQIEEGRQAYIVCPMIEEDESDLVSTTRYLEALQSTPLARYPIAALHGRLPAKEKDALMARFSSGEIKVLVSTTVVEVGVDVPNASVILIENAERFGLSQLHQLRGRVGRGVHQSYCILVSDHPGEENKKRLQVMTSTTDGFVIAEEDLKLRGPGDFFGVRQHGLPNLKIASFSEDMAVLHETQSLARAILKENPDLQGEEYRGLRKKIRQLFTETGESPLN